MVTVTTRAVFEKRTLVGHAPCCEFCMWEGKVRDSLRAASAAYWKHAGTRTHKRNVANDAAWAASRRARS